MDRRITGIDIILVRIFNTIDMKNKETQNIREAWDLPTRYGHVRIKAVRCNKPNCSACPHAYYLYFREGEFGYAKEKYVGKCDKRGMPR